MDTFASIIAQQWAYGALAFVVAAVSFGFAWQYYEAVLKEDGPNRDQLLDRLAKGGGPRIFYIDQMTRLLDSIDRLLGDAGQRQDWVARALRLRQAQPCWTAASFDTCALLAVAYPFASLLTTWLVVGSAGPIGDLIGLRPEPRWWVQLALRVIIALLIFSIFRLFRRDLRQFSVAFALSYGLAVVFALTSALSGSDFGFSFGAVAVALTLALFVGSLIADGGAFVSAGAVAAGFAFAFAVGFIDTKAGSLALNFAFPGASACIFAIASSGAIAVATLARRAAETHRLSTFWLVYWPIALGSIGPALWFAARLGNLPDTVSFLLLIDLLPLVNLPFDWASIGMTRALLRRGCEDHGIWLLRSPTLLGLLDFLAGLALLATLAPALVLTLTAADAILQHAGGRPLFDAIGLIERIAAQPSDAAHAWVYFTLLSTLLPSFFNLLVGVFSLLTFSVPPVRHWLIATIPMLDARGLGGTRWLATFALSAQVFFAILLTCLGLWLVWRGLLTVPGVEEVALNPLHTFAIWCARLFGVAT